MKETGKGNFGVRVENKNDPKDVTIHWSTHKLGQNTLYEGFKRMKNVKVSKKNK